MGKQKEAATTTTSTRSTSIRAKRKEPTDQPAAQRKKQKAEPTAAPAAAAETQPKKDQKKPSSSSGTKKKDKKPTKPQLKKAAAAEQKPKRQSKRQQHQQEEEQEEEPEKSMHDIFMEEIHAKEAELKLHCLVLGQVETEEDETTLEDLRALTRVFVPEKVQDDFVEVWEELDAVGEDSDEEEEEDGEEDDQDQPDILGAIMKAILGGKMLNTKHSAQMHDIFKTHQDKIDKALKSKDFQEAFCRWAAVLMATHREKHWYEDTDVPAAAEGVYKRMRQQWLKLKARSDQELGGLVAEGDKTPKEEFDAYLQAVADDMRSMDYDVQDVLA